MAAPYQAPTDHVVETKSEPAKVVPEDIFRTANDVAEIVDKVAPVLQDIVAAHNETQGKIPDDFGDRNASEKVSYSDDDLDEIAKMMTEQSKP